MSGSLFDTSVGKAAGLVVPGNINLSRRPVVQNADGSISTVRSITFTDDKGNAVLIPTVVNGKVVSNEDAISHYYKTGEHLGIFETEDHADSYGQTLHESQARQYSNPNASLSELLYQALQNR